ncbi:autophagy protein 10 [Cavenderia fasciculata]|uniref:Ubiquitin-like-conjugating enzyme ATG10 n=1 Tax=Cavenderia fasciculata TaxID=261658 RepID=F4Q8L0_CACFS|nr:autophagy protein 10 [Cavenderia fasciculata]EGG16110.1 autophagy protein 10 [Cavenderia fasciculata]|eukprot:XP_004352435.1 autophagy protein 10 [Cavenderia fasciculata]
MTLWDEILPILQGTHRGKSDDANLYQSIPLITQVEHPVLGIPFYQLHPCETANLMKEVLHIDIDNNNNNNNNIIIDNNNDKYLSSWISIISPIVGIKLPMNKLFI